jgi:sugar phosphate isomerase/epimerase
MMTTHPLGVQLYSVRDDLDAAVLPATVARLAAMGYTHLEPYRILENTELLKRSMDDAGVVATTAHANLVTLDRDDHLRAARILGIGTMIIPWVEPASISTRDGVEALAASVNDVAAWGAANGIRIGYHNHDFEFSQHIDGVSAWEMLVELFDDHVILELDTYWASVGGGDVLEILERLGSRIPLLHVKNEPANPDDPAPLGPDITGRMPAVLAAAAPNLEFPVVELVVDDVFTALERNARWFTAELGTVSA